MIYPAGTLYLGELIAGEVTQTILTADSANPITVLSVSAVESDILGLTSLDCGAVPFIRNATALYPLFHPFAVCTDDLVVTKTGLDSAFLTLTYLPFNINESTGSIVLTPTPTTLLHSYTFGELTIALILIPLVLVATYQTIILAFRKPIVRHK